MVRLICINQSLWLDEAITARVITQYSSWELIHSFSPFDFHPPLHYLLMQAWSHIFGVSEIALRLPSVLFSLLAGWLVYQTALLMQWSEKTAWWSTAFFLFHPLLVYYSQEGRVYSMLVFLVAAHFYFLQRLLKTSRFWNWLCFGLLTVLGLWSFYGIVFYYCAVGLYLLWQRKWLILSVFCASGLAGLAILTPLLQQQLANSVLARSLVANWSEVLGPFTIKNLAMIPVKLLSGRLSFDPKWLYYALAGTWTLLVSAGVARGIKKHIWLGVFILAPVALGAAFSLFTPLLQYFRFVYLGIFTAMALGVGLKNLRWQAWMQGGLLAGFVIWSVVSVSFPQFHREDWRSLAQDLAGRSEMVLMVQSSQDPLKYYLPDREVMPLERLPESISSGESVIILPYTTQIHGIEYTNTLLEAGYVLSEEKVYRDLSWERWEFSPEFSQERDTI